MCGEKRLQICFDLCRFLLGSQEHEVPLIACQVNNCKVRWHLLLTNDRTKDVLGLNWVDLNYLVPWIEDQRF